MKEIVRTNDVVLISFIESLLQDAGIDPLIADGNMSILEGSLAMIPRRILVVDDDEREARTILKEAGLEKELRPLNGSGW